MPRISEFYGISIYMYFRDHHPPHFHAFYGQFEGTIGIENGEVLHGYLPKRALRLVQSWRSTFRRELLRNWTHARRHEKLESIPPLD